MLIILYCVIAAMLVGGALVFRNGRATYDRLQTELNSWQAYSARLREDVSLWRDRAADMAVQHNRYAAAATRRQVLMSGSLEDLNGRHRAVVNQLQDCEKKIRFQRGALNGKDRQLEEALSDFETVSDLAVTRGARCEQYGKLYNRLVTVLEQINVVITFDEEGGFKATLPLPPKQDDWAAQVANLAAKRGEAEMSDEDMATVNV